MRNEERIREMLHDVDIDLEDGEIGRVAGMCAMLDGFAARLRAVDVGDAPPATVFSVRGD